MAYANKKWNTYEIFHFLLAYAVLIIYAKILDHYNSAYLFFIFGFCYHKTRLVSYSNFLDFVSSKD